MPAAMRSEGEGRAHWIIFFIHFILLYFIFRSEEQGRADERGWKQVLFREMSL